MQTQEVIEGWRGLAVNCGLGTPIARATTAFVGAGIVCYVMGYPNNAFRRDGSLRPHSSLSMSPEATSSHFILTPLVVAGAVFLFT